MTKEVKDLAGGGITPGRSISNADFCPSVDEHQLNIRETAIMARNSGIHPSQVAVIMAKRQNAASEVERSRAEEARCTHDNLLAAVEQLRAEKDSALERLTFMKKREDQLTQRSRKQDKERERAEKATESSWRDEKEELEFDLENIRSALAISNGKVADTAKRAKRLETELAKTREAAAQAAKSKAEEASHPTPKPSPKRERKGKGGGAGGGSRANNTSASPAPTTEKKRNRQKTKQQQQQQQQQQEQEQEQQPQQPEREQRNSPEKNADKDKKHHVDSGGKSSSKGTNKDQNISLAQKLCDVVKRWKFLVQDSSTLKSTALVMLCIGIGVIVIVFFLAVGVSLIPTSLGLWLSTGRSMVIDNCTSCAAMGADQDDSTGCTSHPCVQGACSDTDMNGSYRCNCEYGYFGLTCEMKFWDRVMSGTEGWYEDAAKRASPIDDTTCVLCTAKAYTPCMPFVAVLHI